VLKSFQHRFVPESVLNKAKAVEIPELLQKEIALEPAADTLKYILHTNVGSGPQNLGSESSLSLLDVHTGLPKSLN
jgi:hypothetical protein